jgi:hypothetical protein
MLRSETHQTRHDQGGEAGQLLQPGERHAVASLVGADAEPCEPHRHQRGQRDQRKRLEGLFGLCERVSPARLEAQPGKAWRERGVRARAIREKWRAQLCVARLPFAASQPRVRAAGADRRRVPWP